MTFVHPQYFHFLWLLPVLLLLRLWAGRGAGRAAESFVAARLRQLLVAGVSPVRSWFMFVLQLLALAGFICTITQPRWGVEKKEITETGKNVIVAIDTSRSMLADDVTPNRLMRAKLAAQDIVLTLQGHRVGLIAFAGRGYLQAPLTTDHDAVIESIQALDTNTIPRGGTMISEAIREALDAFEKTKARNHGLILFSDGGDEDPGLDAILKKAVEKKIIILTVGVGTDIGALIPDPDPDKAGDYVRDPDTNTPVRTHLEEATLRRIAKDTGGRYLRLGTQSLSATVVAEILNTLESMESGNREEVKPIDRFYWPLSAGMLALMIALLLRPTASLPRLSPAAVALVLLCAAPMSSRASIFSSSGDAVADRAQDAYKSQEYANARDLYARLLSEPQTQEMKQRLSYGLGAACQQLKEYDRAVDGFSDALESPDAAMQLRSHQGLGTTLYEIGAKSAQQVPEFTEKAWTDSLRHFEAADSLGGDQNIKENLQFVRKQLEELRKKIKQEKDQKKDKGKKGKKDKGNGDKQKGEGSESEEGEEGEGKEGKDGKQGKQKQNKESKDGKEGEQQTADSKDGKEQDQKQGQEGKDSDKDGEKGSAGEQAQMAQKGPEGKIQANEPGKEGDKKQGMQEQIAQMEAAADEKKQDETGYSRIEARNLLRTYNDMMAAKRQNNRERSVAKDW